MIYLRLSTEILMLSLGFFHARYVFLNFQSVLNLDQGIKGGVGE